GNRNSSETDVQFVFIVEPLNLRKEIFCGFEQWIVGEHILLDHRPFSDLKRSFMRRDETTYRIHTAKHQKCAAFDDCRILAPVDHAKRTTKFKVGKRSQGACTTRARRSEFPHPVEFKRIKIAHFRARFSYRSIIELAPFDSVCK